MNPDWEVLVRQVEGENGVVQHSVVVHALRWHMPYRWLTTEGRRLPATYCGLRPRRRGFGLTKRAVDCKLCLESIARREGVKQGS